MLPALVIASALSACGGGGGESSEVQGLQREKPLAVTADNAAGAAMVPVALAEATLTIGDLAMQWTEALAQARQPNFSRACPNGGSQVAQLGDADGDGVLGGRDIVSISLTNCKIPELDLVLTGTLTLALEAVAVPGDRLARAQLRLQAADSSASMAISGTMQIDRRNAMTGPRLRLTSYADSAVRFSTTGGAGPTEVLSDFDLSKDVRGDLAGSLAQLELTLSSDVLKGQVRMSTAEPLQSLFDTYPHRGRLVARGSGPATALLEASEASANDRAVLSLDQNGDGVAELQAQASWFDFTSGFLWWVQGAVAQQGSVPYTTHLASQSRFELLSPSPIVTVDPSGTIVLQFSRALAEGTQMPYQLERQQAQGLAWGAQVVAAGVQITGAQVVITPSEQLEPGASYRLMSLDPETGQPAFRSQALSDGSQSRLNVPTFDVQVKPTVHASLSLRGQDFLIPDAATTTLSAAGSSAAQVRWHQISGPNVQLVPGEGMGVTVVRPAATSQGGWAVVELEVTNAKGEVDRERTRLRVLGDPAAATQFYLRGEPGDPYVPGQVLFASSVESMAASRYYAGTGTLDVFIDIDPGRILRLLAGTRTRAPLAPGRYTLGVGGDLPISLTVGVTICSEVPQGWLELHELQADAEGTVTAMALDFELDCSPPRLPLRGSVRVNSTRPLLQ